ncbi:hypothetical protein Nepgr_009607 [Nepenthes gracilis]|uniref:RING-type E3 ubiquitin transferase n=1 Tax=Nepenthes gracilis TaxID=150966 RepID=A0AAD3XKB1_NEPGR|nr:hypothetical protein Nepgr_009607 [Nepenthes gracilis]
MDGWRWRPAASYNKLRTPTAFDLQTISSKQAFGLQKMAPVHVEDALSFIILIVSLGILGVIFFSYYYFRSCNSLPESNSLRESSSPGESAADTVSSCHSSGRIHFIDLTFFGTLPILSHWEAKDLTARDGGGGCALECAVCWSPFQDDHVVRLIPKCNHVFHRRCVDPWITFNPTCPLCLTNLAEESGDGVSLPSDSSMPSLIDEMEADSGESGGGVGVRGYENV